MAEEEGGIVKVQPDAVKKGGYCFVRGNPCKLDVCEILPKATANGNKRLHVKGKDVFTRKTYDDVWSGMNVIMRSHTKMHTGIVLPNFARLTFQKELRKPMFNMNSNFLIAPPPSKIE